MEIPRATTNTTKTQTGAEDATVASTSAENDDPSVSPAMNSHNNPTTPEIRGRKKLETKLKKNTFEPGVSTGSFLAKSPAV
jgi:hypothetical protein